MLADLDMVGIWVYPSFMTTVFRFVSDSVFSSICLVSLYDHQGYPGATDYYLYSFRCVTWGEIVVRPYDGSLLERSKLTIAMGQSRVRH